MKTNKLYSVLVLGGAALVGACGGEDAPAQGQGPLSGNGGSGTSGNGGAMNSGGKPAAGGATNTGGDSASGGVASTGGHSAMGGSPNTGGTPTTGGQTGSGGAAVDCCPAACWAIAGPPCPCTGGVCCWLQPSHAGCAHKCP